MLTIEQDASDSSTLMNMAKKNKAVAKNPVAQAMVAMRNKKLSPARRKEIAQQAAATRWAKKDSE